MTPTGEQNIKGGYYVLSYARKWEPVGNGTHQPGLVEHSPTGVRP
jgi:hypothetical protein